MRHTLICALALPLAFAGCYDDPNDAKTWIKKLDDVRESKEAVRQLVKIKDKAAVPPLMELYKKSHDPEQLKAIATFADPASVPLLIEALDYTEDSYDAASIAATALGDIGAKEAVPDLIKALKKTLPAKSRANVVKLESMKALAKIKDPRAVDALIDVMSHTADEQDFFLNKKAAQYLGQFADPKSVPILVRGLWMTGRGADIFAECRTALIAVGKPSVQPLIDALQRKNPDVEADAKKYEFFPGIIEQKAAIVLGDLRAREAVGPLLALLGRPDAGLAAGPGKGVSSHQSILIALGQIGDAKAAGPVLAVLNDPKKNAKHRAAAAEALNLLDDRSALPSLLKVANTPFIKGTTIDPEMGSVVASAATAYSRLADADHASVSFQKVPDEIEDIAEVFKAAGKRLAVAKACKKDLGCYEKVLVGDDKIKAEKAAFELARLGKPGLAALSKAVAASDPGVRMAVLFGIGHNGDKSCAECTAAIDKQIATDESKPPLKGLVEEMRAVRAQLLH